MRPIKFRVWCKVAGKFSDKDWMHLASTQYEHGHSIFDDDLLVVQQFTGLTDKNGQEIYEGDIVNNHEEYNNKKIVNYDPHSCYFCLIDLDDWPDMMYNGEMFNQPGEGSNFSGKIEVIGNVFEGVNE